MGPGFVDQDVAELNRLVEAACDCSPLQPAPRAEMASQVSHGDFDLNFSRNWDPVFVGQFSPRLTAGAEEVALACRNLRPNRMQVDECGGVRLAYDVPVVGTDGVNQQVISKRARDRIQGADEVRPGVQQESDECHAQGTPLGDTAGVAVRSANTSRQGVVVVAAGMEAAVGLGWAGGKPQRCRRRTRNFSCT